MEREIEAQAKEFLAFLEQCSQQPRAKATLEIHASLSYLQKFLTTIQPIIEPWPVTNDPTIASITVPASEMYPTLGPLLEMICRSPVVLAANSSSGGLAELVTQSVIKFSAGIGAGAGSRPAMTAPSAEQSWRAARMRDMFRAQQQQQQQQQQQDGLSKKKEIRAEGPGRQLSYSEKNGFSETRDHPFQDLFKVSDKELREREMEQTLDIMTDNMKTLQDEAAKTELTQTAWSALVTWNRQLSQLCAPLISTPSAAGLLGGIIKTAYVLSSKCPRDASRRIALCFIDSSFVESLMMQQSDASMLAVLEDRQTLTQLLEISTLARQKTLIQLIDSVIQDCAHSPDFYQSRHQITQRHFEPSLILTCALSGHLLQDQRRHLTERILEDTAELAGEIDDWRVVRIWTLLIEWVLIRLGSGKSLYTLPLDPDASPLDQDADLCAMISSACHIVSCGDSESKGAKSPRVSVDAEVMFKIDNLLKCLERYVFETAPPQEMALRRRMAFLIGSAVASSNGLLASLILQHVHSLDKPDVDRKEDSSTPFQDTTTLLNLVSLLMSGESDTTSASTIGELFVALLKELHRTLRMSEASNPYDLRLGTVADLEGIFTKFVSFLRLNVVVTADIVCAIVVYNDPKNSAFWQSVINMVLRIVTESESTPLPTSLPAFMNHLRDLSEVMIVPGLTMALNTLLATPTATATATATPAFVSAADSEVTMPMDMPQ